MEIKPIISFLALGLSALYVLATLFMNSIERAKRNSSSDGIDITGISDIANSVLNNIVDEPILNLRVVDAFEDSCLGSVPTLYTWRSVDSFCLCPSSVHAGHCSPHSHSCKNQSSISINLRNWKGKRFCLDKLKAEDWKLSQGGSFACPDGFRLCKGGVCVRKHILECPITDLLVSKFQPSPSGASYKNISSFVDGTTIFISREVEKAPLVTLTVGIPSTPCINTNQMPLRTNGGNYPIVKIQPKGCEQGGNYGVDENSHIPLDTDREWNFHDAGNNPYFTRLPGYREYVGNEIATLFARRKIEFKSYKGNCMTLDYQSLKDVASDLGIFENLRLGSNITTFILCSIAVLLIGVQICLIFSKYSQNNKFGSEASSLNAVILAVSLLNAFILLILSAVAVPYANAIESNSTLMIELGDSDCFTVEGYNLLFDNLETYILSSFPDGKSYNKMNLVLSILYFLSGIILILSQFILAFVKRRSEGDNYIQLT